MDGKIVNEQSLFFTKSTEIKLTPSVSCSLGLHLIAITLFLDGLFDLRVSA